MEGRCIFDNRGRGLIDTALQRLVDWIPADPVNFLIGVGTGAAAFAYILLAAFRGRNPARRLEAPDPSPEAAIHYEYGGLIRGRAAALPVLIAIVFLLFGAWDARRGAFDLEKLAITVAPTLIFVLLFARRLFRARPAIALYRQGMLLDSWRGETMVPWKDVDYIETDPAQSTGYQSNPHHRLLVGRKDGRKWRYSEHDFGDDAPLQFETISALARRHIR